MLVAVQVGREAAFVADGGGEPLVEQLLLQRVEHFLAHADRLSETAGVVRHDFEFLEVHRVICVATAVDDVETGHWQQRGIIATQVTIQR